MSNSPFPSFYIPAPAQQQMNCYGVCPAFNNLNHGNILFSPYWDCGISNYIPRPEPKKTNNLKIEDLYNLVFPDDPIRDWMEKEIERIEAKYAWLDEIM